jgi:hypothetical protein
MLNLVVLEGEGAPNNIRQRTARDPVVRYRMRIQAGGRRHCGLYAAVQWAGGTFANGSRTLSMVSDNQGRAVARGFRPNGLKGQFQIRVNATFSGLAAAIAITQTNVALAATSGASAGSGKLIAVLVAVGAAAAAGGAYYATHNGNGSPAVVNPATTIAAGTTSVGPPR